MPFYTLLLATYALEVIKRHKKIHQITHPSSAGKYLQITQPSFFLLFQAVLCMYKLAAKYLFLATVVTVAVLLFVVVVDDDDVVIVNARHRCGRGSGRV